MRIGFGSKFTTLALVRAGCAGDWHVRRSRELVWCEQSLPLAGRSIRYFAEPGEVCAQCRAAVLDFGYGELVAPELVASEATDGVEVRTDAGHLVARIRRQLGRDARYVVELAGGDGADFRRIAETLEEATEIAESHTRSTCFLEFLEWKSRST